MSASITFVSVTGHVIEADLYMCLLPQLFLTHLAPESTSNGWLSSLLCEVMQTFMTDESGPCIILFGLCSFLWLYSWSVKHIVCKIWWMNRHLVSQRQKYCRSISCMESPKPVPTVIKKRVCPSIMEGSVLSLLWGISCSLDPLGWSDIYKMGMQYIVLDLILEAMFSNHIVFRVTIHSVILICTLTETSILLFN